MASGGRFSRALNAPFIKGHFKGFFNSYSEILFLQSPTAGALFFLVTLINPNVGIAGIISVAAAWLFARLIGMSDAFLDSGFFTYNALLVGLAIGYFFILTPASVFFIVMAGVFTFVISAMANNILSYYFGLPVLSLPFAIVSPIVYLASRGYTNLHPAAPHAWNDVIALPLPFWLDGFLVSLGAILFSPNALAGMLFAAIILFSSRILFLLAVFGFYLGACVSGLMGGDMSAAFLRISNFNFIVIAMALGGVFLVPSPKSYLIAAAAVAGATILMDSIHLFWAIYGIPVFTVPFNSVTLTFLYVLGMVGFPLVARNVRRTPEETMDEYISHARRFQGSARKLALPFSGKWTVWQGFDGPWTHQGHLRYAYDFVMEKDGATHKNDGVYLTDYHAFKKPVFSPCRGRVVQVSANLPDNAPGAVDKAHHWGNFVIIDTNLGYFVELSHFAHDSIRVREGQWIETGALLGLCGNSGYSPQPHIHVQTQATAWIGAGTLPFDFHGYRENDAFVFGGLPREKGAVEALRVDPGLDARTTFILEQRFTFRAFRGASPARVVTWEVCMTESGEIYLDAGGSRLFFARDGCSFYFYRLEGNDPWLALLFTALPRMPLVYRPGLRWEDTPPVSAVGGRWGKHLLNPIRSLCHDIAQVRYEAAWTDEDTITGTVQRGFSREATPVTVALDRLSGFSRICVGEWRLERRG